MKAVFLTEGGQDMGFGHVTRCLSLCEAFEAEGYSTEFIIDGDASIHSLLSGHSFSILNWGQAKNKQKMIAALDNAHTAVIDSYRTGIDIYRDISERVEKPVFLDDTKRLNYPRGIVVNWSISALDMNYPEKEGLQYLLGPRYISLRKPFWDIQNRPVPKTVESVLMTFGGDDSKNLTPKVLAMLTKEFPGLKKYVVIGNAFTNQAEIEAVMDSNTQLIFSPDGSGMKEIMLKSDIAISSGGQTLYELARTGVPPVVISVAENQINNVNGWSGTGFIENAGFWKDADLLAHVGDKFELLSHYERRKTAVDAGHEVIPENGAKRIIQI